MQSWDQSVDQDDVVARESRRYRFAVPVIVEVSQGFLRQAERHEGALVDLSEDGAGIIVRAEPNVFKVRKRYRVFVHDHGGILEIRNIVELENGGLRLGVQFQQLGLNLQELVSDSVFAAKQSQRSLR